MSKTKFTPGPWSVLNIQLHGYGCNVEFYRRVFNTVESDTENDLKELEANARLIAAAPEMYEFISDIQRRLRNIEVMLKNRDCVHNALTDLDAEAFDLLQKIGGADE